MFCTAILIFWDEHKYLNKTDFHWINILFFAQVNFCFRARRGAEKLHWHFCQFCGLFKFKLIQKNNFAEVGPSLVRSLIILIAYIVTICIHELPLQWQKAKFWSSCLVVNATTPLTLWQVFLLCRVVGKPGFSCTNQERQPLWHF